MFATVDSVRNACGMGLIGNSPRTSGYCDYARQPGDLRSFGKSFRDFSEEARTRGIPSPSFGGFGFVRLVKAYAFCADSTIPSSVRL